MKKNGLLVAFLVAVLVCSMLLVTACEGDSAVLTITPAEVSVLEGKTTTVTAQSSVAGEIVWSVSDNTIISIQKTMGNLCVITGLKPGTAELIATQGDVVATSKITVTALAAQPRVEISQNGTPVTGKLTLEQEQTLQLTATVLNSTEKISLWSSSDPSKASVDNNGLVTALLPGTVTITAAVDSILFADVELEVTVKAGSVYYDLKCGEEAGSNAYNSESNAFDSATALAEDEFYMWHARSGWGMQNVDLEYAYYINGEIHLKYTSDWDPGYWYGFQVFYKNSTQVKGNYYKLSCDINVNEDCTVTLQDQPVQLHAGNNHVEVFYQLTAALHESGTSSFDLALGYNDGTATGAFLKDGEVVISNVAWEEVGERIQLQAPSFTLDDNGVITITDPNATGVAGYILVFVENGVNKGSIAVENGKAIDTSSIDIGTYTVKLQALAADVRYTNSDLSASSAQVVVTEAASYKLANSGNGGAVATPGRWTYWCESWVTISDNTFSNNTLTFGFSNNAGNWYDTQLFYKHPTNVAGTVYKIVFELELEAENGGHVTICGNEVELLVGKHTYEVVATEMDGKPSFEIIFALNGQNNAQEIQQGKITITSLTFE